MCCKGLGVLPGGSSGKEDGKDDGQEDGNWIHTGNSMECIVWKGSAPEDLGWSPLKRNIGRLRVEGLGIGSQ